jgi:iron complex transport system substrate-binding protein
MPFRPSVAAFAFALLLAAASSVPVARSQPGAAGMQVAAPEGGPMAPVFVDSAGRRVVLPAPIGRVMPAERNAEVLLQVLAPDKLNVRRPIAGRGGMLPRSGAPAYDWSLAATPAGMAMLARQTGADLIIDAGPVSPGRAAFAGRVQRLSGVPYILVDDSFSRMPEMLRAIGDLLGDDKRGDRLARYADHAISGVRGRLLITPADSRPRVYFALGPDGLVTALPGSPADMALQEAGVINVAAALGQGRETPVSPGQLSAWNPDYIIAEDRSAYQEFRQDPQWRSLKAVQQRQVLLEPTRPFGWIEDPSGVNRLIGLNWLSTVFYPATTAGDLRTTVCEFYDLFYRTKLTNAEIEAMVRPAGAPPPETESAEQPPLAGLGPEMPVPQTSPAPGAPTVTAPNPAAQSPSALTGVPGLPNTAPNAACAVPTAPTPLPLPGLAPVPGVETPGGKFVPRT